MTLNLTRPFVTHLANHLFCGFASALLLANCIATSVVQAEQIKLPVSRDTWVSTVGSEGKGNNGASSRLKIKSIQEFSIVDLETASLRGKRIKSAKLFMKVSGDEKIDRISISTITSDWNEGTGQNYEPQEGASSFLFRSYPDSLWADGDLTHACLGQGGSFWRSLIPQVLDDNGKPIPSDANTNQKEKWIQLDIPPVFIEARLAGTSYGFVLMDDLGSEWKRDGDKFTFRLFPNRFLYSKDSNKSSAPYWIIELDDATPSPPLPSVSELSWVNWNLPLPSKGKGRSSNSTDTSKAGLLKQEYDSRVLLQWELTDQHAEVVGFEVRCDDQKIPSYFVPHPIIPNHLEPMVARRLPKVEMVLDPLFPPWSLDKTHTIEVIAVDGRGNQSTPAKIEYKPPQSHSSPAERSVNLELPTLAKSLIENDPERLWQNALRWGSNRIAIVDPFDKFSSKTGKPIPGMRAGYLESNALWDAKNRRIELHTGPGHWSSFQLVLQGKVDQAKISFELQGLPEAIVELGRIQPIHTEWKESDKSLSDQYPDPVLPIDTNRSVAKGAITSAPDSQITSLLVEAWIPKSAPRGKYRGTLKLASPNNTLEVSTLIVVHSCPMPDELSFYPEMNCYDLPKNDYDYYRLAQRHRTVLNRVPYFQNGEVVEKFTPGWDGVQLGPWKEWDKQWEGLLSGKLFEDSPRGATPIECFYLPLHENWPNSMEKNYNESYWAEEAFPATYRQQWTSVAKQWNEHLVERGWTKPLYHVFLNNKVDFKTRGWKRGSSPWLLDEPASFQDYLALRFYGDLLNKARPANSLSSPLLYRADISRPQWQRDLLDPVLQYNVCSQSAFRQYRRMVLDRKQRFAQLLMVYGASNPLHASNLHGVLWSWDVWCNGGDGVLPWQTIGDANSWKQGSELALFYPDEKDASKPPVPSIRLKAFRVGQQDVEILRQVSQRFANGNDRYRFGEFLLKQLGLKSKDHGGENEAVWTDYGQFSPEQVTLWRNYLLNQLDQP